jgi:peroxiredoxin
MHNKMNQNDPVEKTRMDGSKITRRDGKRGVGELKIGDVLTRRELVAIQGDPVQIPDPERLVHLQFRRYAGCPVCNLHLRSIASRHDDIVAAGIREVVVFHSTAETMREFQGQLPFAAIADPEKRIYADFGADRKMPSTAALNPRMWWVASNALAQGLRFNRLHGASGKGEEHAGLPAEFLISPDGRVIAAKYGKRIDDHWSVAELLELARHEGGTDRSSRRETVVVARSGKQ